MFLVLGPWLYPLFWVLHRSWCHLSPKALVVGRSTPRRGYPPVEMRPCSEGKWPADYVFLGAGNFPRRALAGRGHGRRENANVCWRSCSESKVKNHPMKTNPHLGIIIEIIPERSMPSFINVKFRDGDLMAWGLPHTHLLIVKRRFEMMITWFEYVWIP